MIKPITVNLDLTSWFENSILNLIWVEFLVKLNKILKLAVDSRSNTKIKFSIMQWHALIWYLRSLWSGNEEFESPISKIIYKTRQDENWKVDEVFRYHADGNDITDPTQNAVNYHVASFPQSKPLITIAVLER